LRDELELLGKYIEIMEIRFQDKLVVERRIDPATLDALVPNLVLQPIVENALEHGAARAAGEGKIELSAKRDGDDLRLCVRDNGPGLEGETGSGVGVANTRARLEQSYGEFASLTLSNADGGGVVATISLPYHTRADRFEGRDA
jgi:LytS/YehU family sensor histidine kinase